VAKSIEKPKSALQLEIAALNEKIKDNIVINCGGSII
jgi:hypothetical protein